MQGDERVPEPHWPDGGLSVGQRIGRLETAVIGVTNRVDNLETFRDEFRGAFTLIKFIFGSSLLTGLVALVTLYLLISGRAS